VATVLLFHHAHGQTPAFHAFAEELRGAGHAVDTPDLYGGRTFDDLDEGVAFADAIPGAEVRRVAGAAADARPDGSVYAGFSFGTYPAQFLAQTRPGARGALIFHGGMPTSAFDAPWPSGVPVQVHTMHADPWVELEVVRALVAEADDAELFLYPGRGHLFADPSLGDYDEPAARLLIERTLAFLERAGGG
jgi:dienelactone hydrolase